MSKRKEKIIYLYLKIKNIHFVALFYLAIASIFAACGDNYSNSGSSIGSSSDLSPSGQSLGSCAFHLNVLGGMCIEYLQSGSATSTGKSVAQTECKKLNTQSPPTAASFSSKGCAISSAFAYCSITRSTVEKGEQVKIQHITVFKPPMTSIDAQNFCSEVKIGQYSITIPKRE
jgi:hypothetical protein